LHAGGRRRRLRWTGGVTRGRGDNPRRASSRSETRLARRLTCRVTAALATSSRSPSAKGRGRRDHRNERGGFGPLGEGPDVGGAQGQLGVPDEAPDPRVDLLAEPLAVEDAVVADAAGRSPAVRPPGCRCRGRGRPGSGPMPEMSSSSPSTVSSAMSVISCFTSRPRCSSSPLGSR
jgi:hypothetical protein